VPGYGCVAFGATRFFVRGGTFKGVKGRGLPAQPWPEANRMNMQKERLKKRRTAVRTITHLHENIRLSLGLWDGLLQALSGKESPD
jgi:hypothetical protein